MTDDVRAALLLAKDALYWALIIPGVSGSGDLEFKVLDAIAAVETVLQGELPFPVIAAWDAEGDRVD